MPLSNFFLVHDISAERGGGILFQVPEFEVICPGTGIAGKFRGTVLGLLLPLEREILWTGTAVSVECRTREGTGTPLETSYWTSLLSSELTAILLANFGVGFHAACLLIGAAGFELEIDVNKMIELMQ
jgi:hypothetical protein